MNQERLLKIIDSPHVSEKALATKGLYVFKVVPDATKIEIKKAVEHVFEVKVSAVQVLNAKGKVKRFSQRLGRRSGFKKAYITLKEGFEIEMASGQS